MIRVDVTVDGAAGLLAMAAYGAGALLRIERATAEAGAYSEITTIPLVAGVDQYRYEDATGTSTSWYRTRVSNAAASNFSGYSDPFQVAEPPLYLSVVQLREHVKTTLVDAALDRLLDAAAQAIDRRAGALGSRTEIIDGGGTLLGLTRPIGSIVSVKETVGTTVTTLLATDYLLRGQYLQRLDTGTNRSLSWLGRIEVVYVPAADLQERIRVQIGLVKLDLAYTGHDSQSIGDYSESQSPGQYLEQREILLASLDQRWAFA